MKKVSLLVAGAMLSAVVAQEASAVPVFARQTGMACNACHFQHFPLLNGFGRAFKSSGYTLMGAQGKVEGEHLSIPDRLNMAVLATSYWQQETSPNGNAANGTLGVPAAGGELSLFYGGRVSEFAGFLSELGLAGAGGTAAAKLPILFEVADGTRAGIVSFTTDGQGASYSFELLNTGAVGGVHRLMGNAGPSKQHVRAYSAAMFLGAARTAATGVAFVANNSMGFVNVASFDAVAPGFGTATGLPMHYTRVAGTFDAGAWDLGVGAQLWGGTSALGFDGKATVLDFQAQGDVGMPIGIYASYGSAPASTGGFNNVMNPTSTNYDSKGATTAAASTDTASSLNIAVEVGVIPGKATVMAGMRSAKLGVKAAGGSSQATDNAVIIGGTYELAQNIELSLHNTRQTGTAWDPVAGAAPAGQNATTLLLETMF